MFWTRAILWKIIKVLGYLIGMVRYYPARKKKYFFCPILDTSTRVPSHLLLQYGESRNESENAPVPYGTFGHRCDHEHLHSLGTGGCQRRDDSHGRIERCQKRTGKDHRREVCDPENVPGGVTIKNGKGALQMQGVFSVENC